MIITSSTKKFLTLIPTKKKYNEQPLQVVNFFWIKQFDVCFLLGLHKKQLHGVTVIVIKKITVEGEKR